MTEPPGRKRSRQRTESVQRRSDSVLDAIDGALSSPYSDAMRWAPPEDGEAGEVPDPYGIELDVSEVTPAPEEYPETRWAGWSSGMTEWVDGQPGAWPAGPAEWVYRDDSPPPMLMGEFPSFRVGDRLAVPDVNGILRAHLVIVDETPLSPEALARVTRVGLSVAECMRALRTAAIRAGRALNEFARAYRESQAGELLGHQPHYGPRDRLPKGTRLQSRGVGPTPSGRPPPTLGVPDTHGHGGRNHHRRRR